MITRLSSRVLMMYHGHETHPVKLAISAHEEQEVPRQVLSLTVEEAAELANNLSAMMGFVTLKHREQARQNADGTLAFERPKSKGFMESVADFFGFKN